MLIDRFVRRRLQIAANSNRRWSTGMETCPAEILHIRPPAPAYERTQLGPEPEQRRPEARPSPVGSSPAAASYERASDGQGIVT